MATSQPNQRSKTGCWTCRLRRKKGNEGGPPCSNCESRGVFCHGYGPRPEWKDRGKLEREQAHRLRLQSRTRQILPESRENSLARHSPASSVSGGAPSPSLQCTTQAETESGPSVTPHSLNQDSNGHEPLTNSRLNENWDDFEFSNDLWRAQNATAVEALVGLSGLHSQSSWDSMDFPHGSWTTQNFLENAELIVGLSNIRHSTEEKLPNFLRDDEISEIAPTSPNLAVTLANMNVCQPTVALRPSTAITFPSLPNHRDSTEVKEREIELLMHFVGETFVLQHPSYRRASTIQRSWLLFLLTRSYTFYCASLSMSAYHCFLTLPGDDGTREATFQDYQKYRACALKAFYEMAGSGKTAVPPNSFLGESMICGVQIALLEALGKNMQECQMHLSSAAHLFHQNPDLLSTNFTSATRIFPLEISVGLGASTSTPNVLRSSQMERKALNFFRALLIWNDILSCAVQTILPHGVQAYRMLLADEEFAENFRHIIGCESWVLLIVMDATLLEIWKRDQDSRGILSIRELVNRAEKIELVLENGITKLSKSLRSDIPLADNGSAPSADSISNIQTYIFAHSLLIHLHAIVSRPWPGVPEFEQSLDRSMSAWNLCQSSINLRTLAWPYCVSASLAVGSQREIFQKMIPEASQGDQALGGFHHLESVVKECWRALDGARTTKVASCDWKEVIQRLNLGILFP